MPHTPAQRVFSLRAFVSAPQRTCPGLLRRLWLKVLRLKPGSATPLSTTPTPGASLCLGDPKTGSGLTMFTFWTLGAGSGPWWRWVPPQDNPVSLYNDFFVSFPSSSSHTLQAKGKVPPLSYHSCSMFRGELFVLGGVFPRPTPESDSCSGSLYIFDPHLSIWYQPIVTGKSPSPRSG